MFTKPGEIKDFVLAGNATLTLESERSGKHLTYRIKKPWDDKDVWFVSLLTGPDNTSDFTYIGRITVPHNGRVIFDLTKKSKMTADAPAVMAIRFMFDWINADRMPPHMRVHHEGRCGRCNRVLTVPESIASGFGPECAGRRASRRQAALEAA